jgi:hypothetical protein
MVSHGGGDAVAVARSTAMPFACSSSRTSSNQSKSYPEVLPVDARLLHQRHVLAPHRGGPLLGVVVAAHRDAGEGEHVVLSSVG